MKTILTINGRHYVLPMPKAIAVMQAMQSAIRVDPQYKDLSKPGERHSRFGYQYTVHEIQDRCSLEQIDDAQIVIPPGVQTDPEPKTKKSRKALPAPPVRQLGFGGVA